MTLQAEVNITKTAANIGFAHWSHDIGGFSGNPTDELYVRWTQFGALSPLYRSHGTYGRDRMYWHYPSFALMKQSLQLRATLAPYVYTSAWRATHSGVGAVHSLYIDHPSLAEAYDTPLMACAAKWNTKCGHVRFTTSRMRGDHVPRELQFTSPTS